MQKDKDPLDTLLEEEIASPIGANAGSGAMPGRSLFATPIPDASPDSMVCLRGPCEHYVQITQRLKHGNTEGTFAPGEEPALTTRFCGYFAADPIDLTDEVVWDCSEWCPRDPADVAERKRIRDAWVKKTGRAWDAREELKKEAADADAD